MLTFAQTIEHAVGFGDRDLHRFPHVYPLYEQAHGLAGKLQRNVEEKGTKHCELALSD
jgi:growth factor-regulated tyrosine kinase substrate